MSSQQEKPSGLPNPYAAIGGILPNPYALSNAGVVTAPLAQEQEPAKVEEKKINTGNHHKGAVLDVL